MKIIKLKELAQMPTGTIFSRWFPVYFGGLYRLAEGISDEDFFYQNLEAELPCGCWDDYTKLKVSDDWSRWGLYDPEEEFAVYGKEDIKEIIKMLGGDE